MSSRRATRSRNANESSDPSEVPPLEDDMLGEEEEDMEEDEVEEVTRCICGNPELQLAPDNPDFDDVDTGFFIQCEQCQVWQHGYCVGIKDEVDAPDKYWCELCKPELHTLVDKGSKDQRSLYIPVTEKKKKHLKKVKDEKEEQRKQAVKNEPLPALSDRVTQPSTVKQSSSPESRQHRRERSRLQLSSRDAEYELQLKKALEESAKESGVQPEDPELSEYTRERSSRRRTRHDDDVKNEDEGDVLDLGIDQEVKRDPEVLQDSNKRRKTLNTADDGLTKEVSDTGPLEDTGASLKEDDKAELTQAHEGSENDSGSQFRAPVTKKKRPRRAVNSKMKSETNENVSPKKSRNKEEIDADKPTKPRIPQQRISMYEMRKRTSAILEFLVRTQSELKYDFENGVDLTQFIDDSAGKSELNKDEIKHTLKNGYDSSITLMEQLTLKIIDWNTKYGDSV